MQKHDASKVTWNIPKRSCFTCSRFIIHCHCGRNTAKHKKNQFHLSASLTIWKLPGLESDVSFILSFFTSLWFKNRWECRAFFQLRSASKSGENKTKADCLWVLEHLTRCCWCTRACLSFSLWREEPAEAAFDPFVFGAPTREKAQPIICKWWGGSWNSGRDAADSLGTRRWSKSFAQSLQSRRYSFFL